jgi:hypothetical protein
MLVKKLMVSAIGTGLLWAAGLAGHAVVDGHPGLLLLAGQARLSLGDREGGLRWMQVAAQQDETSQAATQAVDSAPASSTRVHAVSAKCPTDAKVRRVASNGSHPARVVAVSQPVPAADLARQIARRERRAVHSYLAQAQLRRQMRVIVLQQVRDLPLAPAVPAEPMHANP